MNFKKIMVAIFAVTLIFSNINPVMATQDEPDFDTSKYTIVKKTVAFV